MVGPAFLLIRHMCWSHYVDEKSIHKVTLREGEGGGGGSGERPHSGAAPGASSAPPPPLALLWISPSTSNLLLPSVAGVSRAVDAPPP